MRGRFYIGFTLLILVVTVRSGLALLESKRTRCTPRDRVMSGADMTRTALLSNTRTPYTPKQLDSISKTIRVTEQTERLPIEEHAWGFYGRIIKMDIHPDRTSTVWMETLAGEKIECRFPSPNNPCFAGDSVKMAEVREQYEYVVGGLREARQKYPEKYFRIYGYPCFLPNGKSTRLIDAPICMLYAPDYDQDFLLKHRYDRF